ncbi:expressed unknown protein [Seminavis robusta]|uniref:Fatty acid hydroxylase domain-containing protein n=1 Tax=Seminavis robusta TaxID=568900 RepID=A0A9N8E7L2_9STRA|nr:expressed unknown protein [Seminavis robusta]|eukprot:Sro633_g178870.1 n/a (266) ;mRNA; f:40874-41671
MQILNEKQSTTDVWNRLEAVAASIQEKNPTSGGFLNLQAVTAEDPDIIGDLQAANVSFDSPKTMADLILGYLTHGAGGFITFVLVNTILFRLCLCGSPPGIADLIAIAAARLFWEAQEWAVHSAWFHGDEDGRAMDMFKNHDRHHDIPYYHLSVEPLRLAVVWFFVVLGISTAAVNVLGASPAIVATSFASYQASALTYTFLHAVCHSRIPLQGYLKNCRENHIKHHISPTHHLNMGPNRIDKLMGTDSFDARLAKKTRLSNMTK